MATVAPSATKLTKREIGAKKKQAFLEARMTLLPSLARILHETFNTHTWVNPDIVFNDTTLKNLHSSIPRNILVKGLFPAVQSTSEDVVIQEEGTGTTSFRFSSPDHSSFVLLRHQFGQKYFLLGRKLGRRDPSAAAVDSAASNVENLPKHDALLEPEKAETITTKLQTDIDKALNILTAVYKGLENSTLAQKQQKQKLGLTNGSSTSPVVTTKTARLVQQICDSENPRETMSNLPKADQTRVLRHFVSQAKENASLKEQLNAWLE